MSRAHSSSLTPHAISCPHVYLSLLFTPLFLSQTSHTQTCVLFFFISFFSFFLLLFSLSCVYLGVGLRDLRVESVTHGLVLREHSFLYPFALWLTTSQNNS